MHPLYFSQWAKIMNPSVVMIYIFFSELVIIRPDNVMSFLEPTLAYSAQYTHEQTLVTFEIHKPFGTWNCI